MEVSFTNLMQWLDLPFLGYTATALFVTLLLCGAIGLEREHVHRPAGIRTHLLVGLSSCLVMLTSQFLFRKYQGIIAFDITRLSAQVLSGIGFLGAGTIIREGYSVKGLTTAASLWSVACIGIACGSGFYVGAVLLTIIILSALAYMKNRARSASKLFLHVTLENVDDTLSQIEKLLQEYRIFIHNIEIQPNEKQNERNVNIKLSLPPELNSIHFIAERITKIEGVMHANIQ